jgi:hypothetical protein
VKEQHDELIDEKKLAGDFLSMYDKLGLLYDKHEKQLIDSIEDNVSKSSYQPMKGKNGSSAS